MIGRPFFFVPNQGNPHNRQVLSRKELIDRVAQLASALSGLGVRCGDRVAGYLTNRPETLISFLATASLGAIWSNCPPELSSRGVIDRLSQIEPKVLDGRGRLSVRRKAATIAQIVAGIASLVADASSRDHAGQGSGGTRFIFPTRSFNLALGRSVRPAGHLIRCRDFVPYHSITPFGFSILPGRRACLNQSSTGMAAFCWNT